MSMMHVPGQRCSRGAIAVGRGGGHNEQRMLVNYATAASRSCIKPQSSFCKCAAELFLAQWLRTSMSAPAGMQPGPLTPVCNEATALTSRQQEQIAGPLPIGVSANRPWHRPVPSHSFALFGSRRRRSRRRACAAPAAVLPATWAPSGRPHAPV